jgi:hypothetical protein
MERALAERYGYPCAEAAVLSAEDILPKAPHVNSFAYVHCEGSGAVGGTTGYFDNESEALDFQRLHPVTQGPLRVVSARDIEIDYDVDLIGPWENERQVALHVNQFNRPRSGMSASGRYFGVDLMRYLLRDVGVTLRALSVLNRVGEQNANCFNYAMVALDVSTRFYYTHEIKADKAFSDDRVFVPMSHLETGALIAWSDSSNRNQHAAVSIGYGWVLTKNGYNELQPYRFQRLQETRAIYGDGTEERYYRRRSGNS